jgi:hypothetical protein
MSPPIHHTSVPVTQLNLPLSADGHYNIDVTLRIEVAPPTDTGYFWSNEISFQHPPNGSSGARGSASLGLQQTPSGKVVIFSIKDATAASAGDPGTDCGMLDGAPGYRCSANYDWMEGRDYQLRIWGLSPNLWGAWVTDTITGTALWIGQITAPVGIGNLDSSILRTQVYLFSDVDHCSDTPYVRAAFTKYAVDDHSVSPTSSQVTYSAACANSHATTAATNNATVHEVGTLQTLIRTSLRTSQNTYVSAVGGGGGVLDTECTVGTDESFALIDLGNGQVALEADDGHYVQVAPGGKPTATSRTVCTNCSFTRENHDVRIALKTSSGTYLSVNADGSIDASSATAGPDQIFSLDAPAP